MKNGEPIEDILDSDEVIEKIGGVQAIKVIEEGLNSIFFVKADEEFIIKVRTNKRNNIEWFRAETVIYSRLEGVDIPSPEIIHTDLSMDRHENAFFIMEKMPGKNPESFKEEISFETWEDILFEVGSILSKIHEEVNLDCYGMLGVEESKLKGVEGANTWISHLKEAEQDWKEYIEEGWEEDLDVQYPSKEELKSKLPEGPEPVLLHLDNRLENLMIQDGEIAGFLDWSHPEAGHYEYDLVRAEYLLLDYELDFMDREERRILREKLYDGYRKHRSIKSEGFRERRELYRKITVLWLLAGFPNWKINLSEDGRENMKGYLLEKAEKEL